MRRALLLLPLTVLLLTSAACGTSPAPSTGSATPGVTSTSRASLPPTAPGGSDGAISASLLAKVCSAEYTDESSEVFVAYKDEAPHRLVVTPTRRIADKGNIVFDMAGERLGEDTGGEFPWDDKQLLEKERARVAALMDGAETERRAIPCR